MVQASKRQYEAKYRRLFGYVAGYLPRDQKAAGEYARELKKEALKRKRGRESWISPGVAAFAELIDRDAIVRMYVEEMIRQQEAGHATVDSVHEMLATLDLIVETAPRYNPDPKKQNFFPMSSLFAYMMMTTAGYAAFRYPASNDADVRILNEWCRFLDSPANRYGQHQTKYGQLSEPGYRQYELPEYIIHDGRVR